MSAGLVALVSCSVFPDEAVLPSGTSGGAPPGSGGTSMGGMSTEGGVSTLSGGQNSSGSGGSSGAGGVDPMNGGVGGGSGGTDGGAGPTEGGQGGSGGCVPTTVTLTPVADAYIREKSSERRKNFGTAPTLLVSGIAADRSRAALTFDWSELSSTANVVSARLRLILGTRGGSDATALVARRLAHTWTETGISWAESSLGSSWAIPGGDVALVPSDTVSVASNASAGLAVDLDVTRDVTAILASTEPGYGWMVMTETADSSLEFGARESSFADARPSLVVETCP